MKKMYKKPEMETAELKPMAIVCASITQGQNTSEYTGEGPMITD